MVRPSPRRIRHTAAVCLLAAGAIGGAPAGAVAWDRPVALSPPTAAVDGPYLAADAAGDALLTWARGIPPSEEWGLPPAYRVEGALRNAGAGWAPGARLSPAGELAFAPVPVLEPSGAAAVSWTRLQRGVADVTAGEALHGDGWAFRPIDVEPGIWSLRATATGTDGTLAIAEVDPWQEVAPLRVTVRSPGGAWSQSSPVTALSRESLQVTVTPRGTVLVAALEQEGEWDSPETRTRVVAETWDPVAAAWSAPVQSPWVPGAAADLMLAGGAEGRTLAALDLQRPGRFVVAVTSLTADGTFTAPQILGGGGDAGVRIAASPGGRVFVAWTVHGSPRVRVSPDGESWSALEAPAAGACVESQALAALAAGPSGEALLLAMAGFANDWYPGLVRAWVRRPDGSWDGPVWLSRAFAGSPVAAIDGLGRMDVAWAREDMRSPRVEVTSSTLDGATTTAVPQDPVAEVSHVRVVARGRRRTLRFRLSRAARVTIMVHRARPTDDPSVIVINATARRGANAVVLPVRGAGRLTAGRWTATVQHRNGYIAGCAKTSAPFGVR